MRMADYNVDLFVPDSWEDRQLSETVAALDNFPALLASAVADAIAAAGLPAGVVVVISEQDGEGPFDQHVSTKNGKSS